MAVAPARLYRPRMTLEVEGIAGRLPIARFNSSFELNAIPTASVALAVGREFFSTTPAAIHAIADILGERRRRARVWLAMDADGGADPDRGHPPLGIGRGEFLAFDGSTGALAPSFAVGSAGCTIQLIHWLDELNFSSVFAQTSHPVNPAAYTFGALSGGPCAGVTTGAALGAPQDRNWVSPTQGIPFFTGGLPGEDFWLKALRPWFECLCQQNSFENVEAGLIGWKKNDQALAALRRVGLGPGPDGRPVPLALDMATDADLEQALSNSATVLTLSPGMFAHVTIWDALVGKFASDYMFAVVPLIARACVVPFVPGYRRAFKVIPAAHGTQIEWTGIIARTLRGVGVLAGVHMDTAAGLGAPNAEMQGMGIGGFYRPDPDAEGTFLIREGPDWVGGLYSATLYGDSSTGAAGAPMPDAQNPGVVVAGDPPGAAIAARRIEVKRFLDCYAQALYALEMLRGRQAIAAGPVRFDIAPGSTILVHPGDRAGDDKLRAPFYATVLRVSTYLDAEGARAGTGFHLSHCRSEKENESDRTSIAGHPIYRGTFAGCGLLD